MVLFVTTIEELEDLMTQYNLEDCGMSGEHYGYHWFYDSEKDVNVYVDSN